MRKDAEEHRCGEPSLEQVAEETQNQVDEDAGTTEVRATYSYAIAALV